MLLCVCVCALRVCILYVLCVLYVLYFVNHVTYVYCVHAVCSGCDVCGVCCVLCVHVLCMCVVCLVHAGEYSHTLFHSSSSESSHVFRQLINAPSLFPAQALSSGSDT